MNVRLLVCATAAALALCACGGGAKPRPDGGLAVCDPGEETYLAVKVVDASGNAVGGATVKAKNSSSGQTVTATTSNDGVTTAFGTNLGSGSVQVQATSGSKVSDTKQAEFVCGECSCTIQPATLTLTLSP